MKTNKPGTDLPIMLSEDSTRLLRGARNGLLLSAPFWFLLYWLIR
ncbi:MAG TPA: hypothetical protein VMS18_19075 [Candidatus Binatia bacterium]|nr:hypothetical protein [Candidatus Binatia bacterium]